VIICHCRGINDSTVVDAIDEGMETVDELAEICGTGSDCGGCRPALAELIGERTGQPAEHAHRTRTSVA
jgi:bacterioferritin-associated ferredoxin